MVVIERLPFSVSSSSLRGAQSNDLEGFAGAGQFSMPTFAPGGTLFRADSHIIIFLDFRG
jgi:hypothetical protein